MTSNPPQRVHGMASPPVFLGFRPGTLCGYPFFVVRVPVFLTINGGKVDPFRQGQEGDSATARGSSGDSFSVILPGSHDRGRRKGWPHIRQLPPPLFSSHPHRRHPQNDRAYLTSHTIPCRTLPTTRPKAAINATQRAIVLALTVIPNLCRCPVCPQRVGCS